MTGAPNQLQLQLNPRLQARKSILYRSKLRNAQQYALKDQVHIGKGNSELKSGLGSYWMQASLLGKESRQGGSWFAYAYLYL
jgi:hypothetical protein